MCYSKNPKHFEDYAHPWLDGHLPAQSKDKEEAEQIHEILSLAKTGDWRKVKRKLRDHPQWVNVRPPVRQYGLVHHAAWQLQMDAMETLYIEFSADLSLRTKDGKSVEDVFLESQAIGGLNATQEAQCKALQKWLRRRVAEINPGVEGGPPVVSEVLPTDLKPQGAVITAWSTMNRELSGDFAEMMNERNGYPAYVREADDVCLYIYYSFREDLGWVMDDGLRDTREPLAYLGPSTCGTDPCAKAFGEAWKVRRSNRLAGDFYARDSFMKLKRKK